VPSRPPESAGNLFRLPDPLPPEELVETLARAEGVLVERIVATGHVTPRDEWLSGERDEWVVLLTVVGEPAREPLVRVEELLARNNAVIMAVLLLLIGAKLLGDAISGFSS
jgi:hypothetical protein